MIPVRNRLRRAGAFSLAALGGALVDLTGSALLLEGGTDNLLLEGDATDGDDILLLEGTA